jgi:hypothetical protein
VSEHVGYTAGDRGIESATARLLEGKNGRIKGALEDMMLLGHVFTECHPYELAFERSTLLLMMELWVGHYCDYCIKQ